MPSSIDMQLCGCMDVAGEGFMLLVRTELLESSKNDPSLDADYCFSLSIADVGLMFSVVLHVSV